MKSLSYLCSGVILISLAFDTRCAGAATFNIAIGDVAALKNAITTANSNQQDDVINLATDVAPATGLYTLTTVDNTLFGPTGLPVIGNDFVGPNTSHSLTINGNGATITRSSTAPSFRIFALHQPEGGSVAFNNLTISNGSATDNPTGASGGAIMLGSHSLTIQNCTFSGNLATGAGGAIYSGGSSDMLTVRNSTFMNNNGDGSIYNFGTLTVNNSTFANNAGSGGIRSNGMLASTVVTNSTLSANKYGIIVDHAAELSIGSTILKSTTSANLSALNGSTITSQGYNLSSDNGGGFLTSAADQISTNPRFDPAGCKTTAVRPKLLGWPSTALRETKAKISALRPISAEWVTNAVSMILRF